ncbi:MAG: M28 family metallopeptidase [Halanaerobiales bacterium]
MLKEHHMRRSIITFLIVILVSSVSFSEILFASSDTPELVSSINYTNFTGVSFDIEYTGKIIEELSSERYQGRLYGKEGNKAALDYIIEQFNSIGLKSPGGLDNYERYHEGMGASNLIAYIEAEKAENLEYILITAHIDHLGTSKSEGSYFPGALDNASGVASMVTLARIIQENDVQPSRNIVFIAFNAEEIGLLGSRYYVQDPVFPLEKSILINLDMIGSQQAVPLTIQSYSDDNTGLRDELCKLAAELNIDYTPYVSNWSDHYSFKETGIPAVSLTHNDPSFYHTIDDTADKINLNRARSVIELVLKFLDENAY